jgi:protein TonB
MSKFSIYSKAWIDLVFENKNQDYGAFQLRQKSDETTLLAFCLGLTVVATMLTIPMFISSFQPYSENSLVIPNYENMVVQVSDFRPSPPKKPEKTVLPLSKKETTKEITAETLINPEIVKSSQANPEITTKTSQTTNASSEGSGTNSKEATTATGTFESGKPISNIETPTEVLNTTVSVDKLPEFPGGLGAFYKYVGEKFEAFDVEETVTVFLSFVIEKDGTITDIKVLRSATPSLDKEAIRVLKSLRTKWKPGVKDGQNVRTLYKLPIKVTKK